MKPISTSPPTRRHRDCLADRQGDPRAHPGGNRADRLGGRSYNKFLAKLASGQRKPNGQFAIQPARGRSFRRALPVAKFHGVGPATAQDARAWHPHRRRPERLVLAGSCRPGSASPGAWYYEIARGQDQRPVKPDRERKSSGSETTFEEDLTRPRRSRRA